MKKLVSINPANGCIIQEYTELSNEDLLNKINKAREAFLRWSSVDLSQKINKMKNFVELLESKKNEAANLITLEMGKLYKQSISEIDKCIYMIKIYIKDIPNLISDEKLNTSYKESYITFEPLGVLLGIMPWNFPFWQVLRFAAPNIMLGNVILIKHSSNVQGCAFYLEKLFRDAGFDEGIYQNLAITSEKVSTVITHDIVKGVSLTGSDKSGSFVASLAGKEIKKTVLELGGSDPFLVFSDLNLGEIVKCAVASRIRNAGQACTSAKRFIILEKFVDKFIEQYVSYFKELRVGDPFDDNVDLGPLVSEEALLQIINQIQTSIDLGAKLEFGGKRINREGFYLEPTVVSNLRKGMPLYDEEIFGPVAAIISAKDEEDAIRIANDTKYGLSASIWMEDVQKAKEIAKKLEVGSVYINSIPSSDPRMPFGGIKKSGYGRELSKYGLIEFLNIKSLLVG